MRNRERSRKGRKRANEKIRTKRKIDRQEKSAGKGEGEEGAGST